MTLFHRIRTILLSLVVIVLSLLMLIVDTELGTSAFILYLVICMLVYGIRRLIYFFTMGIHMIGGKLILYQGLIGLDCGILLFGMNKFHPQYVMLYLLGWYLFSGVVSLVRALEMRRLKAGSWRFRLAGGLFSILIAVLCLCNLGSESLMMSILCIGFIYSAVVRIITALRRTAVVYIQ